MSYPPQSSPQSGKTPLRGKTIAVILCSGFEETPFMALHKRLNEAGAEVKIISPDPGLTNGWSGEAWGLSWPVDAPLSETLAVDYDGLIIPHGTRHSTLLAADAHGRRVVNAFLRADAPALIIGSAVEVIAEIGFTPPPPPPPMTGQPITSEIITSEIITHGGLIIAPAEASPIAMIDTLAHTFARAHANTMGNNPHHEEQAA